MKNTLIFNLESIGKKKEHLTSAELSRLYLNLLRDCLDFQQFPTEQFLDRFVNNTITSLRQTSDLDTFAITEEIVSLLVKNVDKRQVLMSTSLLPTLFELVLTPTTTFALKKRILELACKIVSLKIPLECRSGVRCNVEKYLYGLVSDFRKSKNSACHPLYNSYLHFRRVISGNLEITKSKFLSSNFGSDLVCKKTSLCRSDSFKAQIWQTFSIKFSAKHLKLMPDLLSTD